MTKRLLLVVRVIAASLMLLLLVGFTIAAWIVIESFAPEPGANMILMALPFVAGLMVFPGAGLLVIAIVFRQSLHRAEFVVYLVSAAMWLLPGVALYVLG